MKILKNKKRFILLPISFVVAVIILVKLDVFQLNQPSLIVSNIKASNMMNHISSQHVRGKDIDQKFIINTADFSVDLFKNAISKEDNSLISPVSTLYPLSMAANGADKNTLIQILKVIGKDITLENLNRYLYTFRKNLKSSKNSKLNISNSIWFRDVKRFKVEKNFLQNNADYYDAPIYKSAFDDQTLTDMNNWVKNKTNGNIDRIIERIDSNSVMYIISTLEFDAKWKEKYKKDDISDNSFLNLNGSDTDCKFMTSTENYYLDDREAVGFMKPYYNDNYRFVALLPKDGINSYINQMSGEKFIDTLKNATETSVSVTMPEFHYEYSINMNDALSNLGMPDAFSTTDADFGKLGQSSAGNIFIKEVLQKIYIYVDDHGTKAGAATSVMFAIKSAPHFDKSVILDRPFIYAIVDTKTNLPIFLGVVTDLNSITK